VVILLPFFPQLLGPSTWPESVRELGDSESPFIVELFPFTLLHIRQQAEVVFLNRLLPAPDLKLALGTMAVKDQVWRRIAGNQRGDFLRRLMYLFRQSSGFHPTRGVVISVNDLADAYFTPAVSLFVKMNRNGMN